MDNFITVARVGEVKPGQVRRLRLSDIAIALFNAGGAFYAVEERCAADGASLSASALTGTEIECSADRARFYLPTGECLYPPAMKSLATYRVRVDGDEIKVEPQRAIAESPEEKIPAPNRAVSSADCGDDKSVASGM